MNKATLAFVLALISLLLPIPIVNSMVGIVAIVVAIIVLSGEHEGNPKSLALTALFIALIGIVLWGGMLYSVVGTASINATQNGGGVPDAPLDYNNSAVELYSYLDSVVLEEFCVDRSYLHVHY